MGVYYRSLIETLKNAYQNQDKGLEDFLETQQAKSILEDHQISSGGFHWALNIGQLFKELKIEPKRLKDAINKPLAENKKDWDNDNFDYLIKKE